ncbi:MAG: S-layer homology domain-containing protein, partial [Lysinibacillus sp.]
MKKILISFLFLSAVILIGRPILNFLLHSSANQDIQKFVGQYHIDYDQQLTTPQSYVDIHNLHPLKNEVTALTAFGLALGDMDGQLRSAKEMTHGEVYDLFNQIKTITKKDLTFDSLKNDDVLLTHEQLAQLLVTTFELQPVKNDITFKDEHKIHEQYVLAMKTLAQHGISTGYLNKIYPNEVVNRATTITLIYRAAIVTNHIAPIDYTIEETPIAPNLIKEFANIYSLPFDRNVYIRSDNPLTYLGHTKTTYETASDDSHNYAFDDLDATLTVTTRTFKNDDQFIFITLNNHSTKAVTVDLIERHPSNVTSTLYRFDRYPLQRIGLDVFGEDTSTYPVGVQQLMSYDTLIQEKMIGQAYRSQQLSQHYEETGGTSVVRNLQLEYDPLSTVHLSTAYLNVITLHSNGNDLVDTWYMMSKEHLFTSNESMEAWMLETSQNFIKRNKWYTANGIFNKMATSIEPMPEN